MEGPFLETDIAPFLALASEEGWSCESWELEFLLQRFPQGCFVCRREGSARGYVTSIRYGRSGWIGNLLVHADFRGCGIGRALIERSIHELSMSGVETIWLTASAQGAGLYRKLGFVEIDSIDRWTGRGANNGILETVPLDMGPIRELDRAGWGERRDALLQAACGRGRLYSSSGGFICVQQWEQGVQIGPWGSVNHAQAGQLLDQALAGAGARVFLDVPAGNRVAAALLEQRGFGVKGSSILMYLGVKPLYQPANIFALASMGSMG